MANDTDHPHAVAANKLFTSVVDTEVMKKLGINIDLGAMGIKLSDPVAVASNNVPNVIVPDQGQGRA